MRTAIETVMVDETFLLDPANNARRAVFEGDIPLSGAEKIKHRCSIHEG
jgi:hypothetical protein